MAQYSFLSTHLVVHRPQMSVASAWSDRTSYLTLLSSRIQKRFNLFAAFGFVVLATVGCSDGGGDSGDTDADIKQSAGDAAVDSAAGHDARVGHDASLNGLTVATDDNTTGLSPGFASNTLEYDVTVPFRTKVVTITPTANDPHVKSITVTQDDGPPVYVASGAATALAVPNPENRSRVAVAVTAEDGIATMVYALVVHRVVGATDAKLISLVESAGALKFDPSSSSTEYSYNVTELLSANYTITPTANDPRATISVNGSAMASGSAFGIDLSTGSATVLIAVTAEDGATSMTYTLHITVWVPVTGIALSAAWLRLHTVNSVTGTLSASLTPSNATDQVVHWTSDNPSVASVGASGVVTAISIGQAVVTAASHDGGFTAICTVYVLDKWFIDGPAEITLSPGTSWVAEAGDAPRVVTVAAWKPDTATGTYVADTFSVTSSDPTVVSAVTSDNRVTFSPLKAGTATITFTSGSDPTITRVLNATIGPAFAQVATAYTLTGRTTPAAGEAAAHVDTRLDITFDCSPKLGTVGSVRIFKKSDDSLVDVIRLTGETDSIGYLGQDRVRIVNAEALISVSGNTVTIRPHNDKLAYGTEYYVAIANGVVMIGCAINGTAFDGIGKAGGWSFTTRAAPANTLTSLTVDDDGQADFRTLQGALNYLMKNAAKDAAVSVYVKNGTYQELLFLRAKNNVTITGESRDGVVIFDKNYDALNSGSGSSQVTGSGTPGGGRAVFLVETSDLLTLNTLTLKNTTLRAAGVSSQAETVYFNNDVGRFVAKNAVFRSEQDTLQLKGYSWFYNTLIEGNIDFIWGSNRVSLFENSEIRTVADTSNVNSGGYVVQARTAAATDKGFVFLNSKLTHGPGPSSSSRDVPTGTNAATYLARSKGSASLYDNVAFVNCKMDTHIIPIGWAYNVKDQPVSNPATATAASGWREYGSADLSGVKLDLSQRVGGHILTDSEFANAFSSRAQILSAYGNGAGWNPQP